MKKYVIENLCIINAQVKNLKVYLSRGEDIQCAYAIGILQAKVRELIEKIEMENDEKIFGEMVKIINKENKPKLKAPSESFCCASDDDYMQ